MTTTTMPPVAAEQRPAANALANLLTTFPGLPAPLVSVYRGGQGLSLQVDGAAAFEQWRAELDIAPETVRLRSNAVRAWLETTTTWMGVPVHLSGYGLLPVGGAR